MTFEMDIGSAAALLHQRVSVPRLQDPGPTTEQLEFMFQAALRAPDHGRLRPWRFLLVEGAQRERLGTIFAQAMARRGAVEALVERAAQLPLRAPLLIVGIASPKAHPKIPQRDQLLAAACAVHGLLLGAHAQGVGAIWRTGELAEDPEVMAALGLQPSEQIISFLYLGTPVGELHHPPLMDSSEFFQVWGASD